LIDEKNLSYQLPVDQLTKSPTTLKLMCPGWEQLQSLSDVMIYFL